MRERSPWRSKYSERVVRPNGYISKMGVEGTMSDTGPYMIDRSRKSYVAGQCTKMMSSCSTSLTEFLYRRANATLDSSSLMQSSRRVFDGDGAFFATVHPDDV